MVHNPGSAQRLLLVYQNGVDTRFDWSGDDLTTEINGTTWQITRRYVHGPESDDPLVWYEGPSTSDRRWLHADERGSIIAVSNSAGAALAINRYDEYGIPASTNIGRFQYTGQAWLPEVGLYYYKARMYSPTLGRFMQTDPIGYGDGINWYDYVDGDPVNRVDPDVMESGSVGYNSSMQMAKAIPNNPMTPGQKSAARAIGRAGVAVARNTPAGRVISGLITIANAVSNAPSTPQTTSGLTGAIKAGQDAAAEAAKGAISENRGRNRGGQGQGERGYASSPEGTGDAGKHKNPGKGYRKNPHTGQKIPLRNPPPGAAPPVPTQPKGKRRTD